MRINSETRLYALIGDPVEHSFSPLMHNAAFQILGLNRVYLALQVKPRDLKQAVEGIRSLGIRGFNVTIPHKVSIMKHLDEVDSKAADIGAVNTVLNRNGKLTGYNTDGAGAVAALKGENVDPVGKKVVLLGAGGAARALSFYIAPYARRLVILNRTESKAAFLAEAVKERLKIDVSCGGLTSGNLSRELADADILINATSAGMYPNVEETLVDRSLIRPDMIVLDIVYNPPETRLLREARAAGAKGVNGIMMLVHQGALSFEIWISEKPPIEVMLEAVEKALRRG